MPICKVLPIAPSTYNDHLAKRADPARLPERVKRDTMLKPEVSRVFKANYQVYGARKIWLQLGREGVNVARCTVARLMKDMGLQALFHSNPFTDCVPQSYGKPMRTTFADKSASCPRDHVNRQFFAPRANMLCGKQFPATGSGRLRTISLMSQLGAALFMWLLSSMSLPQDCGLAGQQNSSCGFCLGCVGAGAS